MDPKLLIDGIPLLFDAAKAGYPRFRRWRESDNFTRLVRLLDQRFERHEFLYGQDWSFLRSDAEDAEALEAFFVSEAPLRPALLEAVERHLSVVSDAAPPLRELAEEVVAVIEDVANELWSDDTDRIVFELRRLVGPTLTGLDEVKAQNEAILEQIQRLQREEVRIVSFSSAPEDLRPGLERLAEDDETAAIRLNDTLLGGASVIDAAESLIDEAPSWVMKGPAVGQIWHLLGRIAARNGRWARAEQAYLRAADLGFARPATAIARAGEAAHAQGESERFDELLERAERIDAADIAVSILRADELNDPEARLTRLESARASTKEEEAALGAARARARLLAGEAGTNPRTRSTIRYARGCESTRSAKSRRATESSIDGSVADQVVTTSSVARLRKDGQ